MALDISIDSQAFDDFTKNVNKISTALDKLNNSVSKSKRRFRDFKFPSTTISSLATAVKKLDAQALRNLLTMSYNLVAVSNNLAKVKVKNTNKLPEIGKSIIAFIKNLEKEGISGASLSLPDNLAIIIDDLIRITTKVKRLDKANLYNFERLINVADFTNEFVQRLSKAGTSSVKEYKISDSIVAVVDQLVKISTKLNKLTTLKGGKVAGLKEFTNVLKNIATFTESAASISKQVEGKVGTKGTLGGLSIISIFEEISTAAAKLAQAAQSGAFSKSGVTSIFRKLPKDLRVMMSFIKELGKILGEMGKSFKNVNPQVVYGIAKSLDASGRAIINVVNAAVKISEAGGTKALGLSKAGLFKSAGTKKALLNLITDIGFVIQRLTQTKYLRRNIDANAMAAVAKSIAAVGKVIYALFNVSIPKKSMAAFNEALIQSRVEAVLTVFKGISKLKGFKGKSAIQGAALFEAIAKVIPAIMQMDTSKLKDFDSKKLVKFFQAFEKFKLPKGVKGKDFADIVSGLGNLGNLDKLASLSGDMGQFGTNVGRADSEMRDLGKTIVFAILKVELLKVAGRALLSLFNNLNPLALAKHFVTFGKKALSTLNSISNGLNQLGQKLRQFGDQLQNLGRTFINNFGVGKILNSAAFQSAAEFDQITKQVQVFGNMSEETTKQVQDLAFEIGKNYPLSANDAIKASLNLVKAGLDAKEIGSVLPNIADLTALSDSGDIDAISSAMIQVVSTFDSFKDGVAGTFENSAEAANILSAAADASVSSVESLADGLSRVGPIANSFGFNMQETTAALALFSNAGLDGAEAGTQFKSMLNNLQSDTAKQALKSLGVSITDDAGNFRDLNDIINDLNSTLNETQTVSFRPSNPLSPEAQTRYDTATKALAAAQRQLILYQDGLSAGSLDSEKASEKMEEYQAIVANANRVIMEITGSQEQADYVTRQITRTQAQNASTIKDLAGAYGSVGLNILLAAGEDGIKNLTDQMDNVPPASERAMMMLDNFRGSVTQLKGSVETLMTKALLPMLDKFFRPAVDVIRVVVNALIDMDDSVLEFIVTAGVLGSIFATISGAGLILVGTLIKIGSVIFPLLGMMFSFHKIILGIIVGFGTFVSGLVIAAAAFSVLLPLIGGATLLFESIRKVFSDNLGGATDSLNNLRQTVSAVFSYIINIGKDLYSILRLLFSGDTETSLVSLGAGIATALAFVTAKLQPVATALSQIKGITSGFFRFLTRDKDADSAAANLEARFNKVGAVMDVSGEELTSAVRSARQHVTDEFDVFLVRLSQYSPIFQQLLGGDTSIENIYKSFEKAQEWLQVLRKGVRELFSSVAVFFTELGRGRGIGEAFNKAANVLKSGFASILSTILTGIQGIFKIDFTKEIKLLDENNLGDAFSSFGERIKEKVKQFLLNNRDFFTNLLNTIFSTFFVPGKIFKFIADFLGIDEIKPAFEEFERILTGLFGGIVDTIFNLLEGQDLDEALVNAFGPGIQPIIDFAKKLGEVVGSVIQLFQNLFTAIFGPGGEGKPLEAGDIIQKIFGTASKALSGFNDKILKPLIDLIHRIDFRPILNFFNSLISTFGGFVKALLQGDFGTAFREVGNFFSTIGDAIGKLFTSLTGKEASLEGIFSFIIESIRNGITGIFNAFTSLFHLDPEKITEGIKETFSGLVSAIQGKDPISIIGNLGSVVVGFLADGINVALTTLGDVLKINVEDAKTALNTAFTTLQTDLEAGDIPGSILGVGNVIVQFIGQGVNLALQGLGNVLGIDTTDANTAINNSLQAVADTLIGESPDVLTAVSAIGNAVVTLLGKGINLVFTGVQNLTGVDLSGVGAAIDTMLSTNLETLKAGGVESIFGVTISTLSGILTGVFDAAFAVIGAALGIDVQPTINMLNEKFGGIIDALKGLLGLGEGDETSFVQDIIKTVKNLFNAITNLFSLVSGKGGEGGTVGDVGATDSPLQILVDVLGKLAGFALDTVALVITKLDMLFDSLAQLDAPKLLVVFGGMALAIASMAGAGVVAGVSALTAFFTTSILPLAAAAGGIISVVLILVNFINRIKELEGLDLGGILKAAISSIFDTAFDIIDLLGINDLVNFFLGTNTTVDQMKERWDSTWSDMAQSVKDAATSVKRFLDNIGYDFYLTLQDMSARVADFAPGESGESYWNTKDFFEDRKPSTITLDELIEVSTDGTPFNKTVAGVKIKKDIETWGPILNTWIKQGLVNQTLTPENLTTLRNILGEELYNGVFVGAFSDVNTANLSASATNVLINGLEGIGAELPPEVANTVGVKIQSAILNAVSSGEISPAEADKQLNKLGEIFPGLISNWFSTASSEMIVNEADARLFASQIITNIENGFLDQAQAMSLFDVWLTNSLEQGRANLTSEQIQSIREGMLSTIEEISSVQNETIATTTTTEGEEITVKPNVAVEPGEVTVNNPEETTKKAQEAVKETVESEGFTVSADGTIDIGDLSTVEGIDAYNTRLEVLTLTFEGLLEKFEPMTTGLSTLTTDFLSVQTVIDTTTTDINDAVVNANAVATTQFIGYSVALGVLGIAYTLFGITATTALQNITNALFLLQLNLITASVLWPALLAALMVQFDLWATAVVTNLNDVYNHIDMIVGKMNDAALAATAATAAANGTGGGGGGNIPGMAEGGPVRGNSIYEVVENGTPEVFRDRTGRTYLIPAKSGVIAPLEGLGKYNTARSSNANDRLTASDRQLSPAAYGQNVDIKNGDVNITIQGGNFKDEKALAAEIRRQLTAERSKQNIGISTKLRTAGRSI